MRKLILSMHVSLDGFVAGPGGAMNWIQVDDELFDFVGRLTDNADTALYGRVTYQMMDSYWPTAADDAGASKHDIEHSRWYNSVQKIVLSKTLDQGGLKNTTVIGDNLPENINAVKQQPGKDILIFGSPTAVHALLAEKLIDELWLFINPVLVGEGIPLFKGTGAGKLKLLASRPFSSGVIGLHYSILT